MKSKFLSCFIICVLCSIAFPVLAEYKLQTPDGKTVLLKDNGTWEQVPSETKNATDYQLMDIDDLKVDIGKLAGTKVKISGFGSKLGGQMLILNREISVASAIFVDIKSLSRDQRKFIITNCDSGWCKVIVYGTVGKVTSLEDGIIAEKVEW